jgi:hypothetical protein
LSEIEAWHYCPNCKEETLCMFGGSGHNGNCLKCNQALNPDETYEPSRMVSQSVVDKLEDYPDDENCEEPPEYEGEEYGYE